MSISRQVPKDHQTATPPGASHHWLMMLTCVPVVIIAIALIATGAAGAGFVLFAVACVVMMALMMRGMSHDRRF